MVLGRDKLFFMGSFMFLIAFSWYSYNGYQVALKADPVSFAKTDMADIVDKTLFDKWDTIIVKDDLPLTYFESLGRRNPFEQYKPIEVRMDIPVTIKLPEQKPLPEPKIEEPKKEVINYIYRGIVVLGEKVSYVIEREKDRKTYFLNKGNKTNEFVVLETSEKQVVISDVDDNIRVLKVARKK